MSYIENILLDWAHLMAMVIFIEHKPGPIKGLGKLYITFTGAREILTVHCSLLIATAHCVLLTSCNFSMIFSVIFSVILGCDFLV